VQVKAQSSGMVHGMLLFIIKGIALTGNVGHGGGLVTAGFVQ